MNFHYVIAGHPQGNYTIRFPAFEDDLGVLVQGSISKLSEVEHAKVYLDCLISEKIKQRKSIPVDSEVTQDRLVVLDWQTELRIRIFNTLLKEGYDLKAVEYHLDYPEAEVNTFFCIGTPLDLGLAFNVIDHFDLPIKVNVEKVTITAD